MKNKQQLFLWVFIGVAIFLGALWQFFPLPDAKNRLEDLPLTGPDFKGYNVPVTPVEKEIFTNVNMIKRIYEIGKQKAFIYVLDGTHNRHAVHDPTYCFRGSGWDIIKQEYYPIKGGTALLFQLGKKDSTEKREALLWFSDGKHHDASPFRYWIKTALRRLTLGYSGPEPVLIVIQPINTETLDWNAIFEKFPEILQI